MRLVVAALVGTAAWFGAAARADFCQVPDYITGSEGDLSHVTAEVAKDKRLDIVVVGTGSAVLPGPNGARSAFPARLEAELSRRLPGVAVKVTADVKTSRIAADMVRDFAKILIDAKPALVVWQTGTVDAMRGVDADLFRATIEEGIETLQAGGADVVLINMQFSPRTESMIAASNYNDGLRAVAQQQNVPLFDRLAVMKHWHEDGVFDLAAPTRSPQIAEKVHDCIGRLLAGLIIDNAHLPVAKSEAPAR
jgi:hypothetical protein